MRQSTLSPRGQQCAPLRECSGFNQAALSRELISRCRLCYSLSSVLQASQLSDAQVLTQYQRTPNSALRFHFYSTVHNMISRVRPQHNTTQHNTTQHNTTQHNTTQHNTTQHNTTQHNTTQHNTTQHNTTQHNTTQHNTTQHNTTQHNTTYTPFTPLSSTCLTLGFPQIFQMNVTEICTKLATSWPMWRGKRVLVIGMGGGCDCFAAHAVSTLLSREMDGCTMLYGNCIGPRDTSAAVDVTQRNELFRFTTPTRALLPSESGYGTLLLESSLPRCTTGSPYLLMFQNRGLVPEVTAHNTAALKRTLDTLSIDCVVGVDCGGDSLTGGVDWKVSPDLGRDVQVLHSLHGCGRPFVHVVLGPGCDAESPTNVMLGAVNALDTAGHFRGSFHLGTALPLMRPFTTTLAPNRTPNLMYDAWKQRLHINEAGNVSITRHKNTEEVPAIWLEHGLVFAYD